MKRTLVLIILAVLTATLNAQQLETAEQKAKRMHWFKEAKLGVFIHWGIYAVNGIDESWSFYNGYISHADYMKQLEGFTAKSYNPEKWAELIAESGAKYAVLTSKHHDGVALWNTKQDHYNVLEHTPAGKDLIGPFAKAIRKEGLKLGLYQYGGQSTTRYWTQSGWNHPRRTGYPLKRIGTLDT
jgi:alpha-L-fucosidase